MRMAGSFSCSISFSSSTSARPAAPSSLGFAVGWSMGSSAAITCAGVCALVRATRAVSSAVGMGSSSKIVTCRPISSSFLRQRNKSLEYEDLSSTPKIRTNIVYVCSGFSPRAFGSMSESAGRLPESHVLGAMIGAFGNSSAAVLGLCGCACGDWVLTGCSCAGGCAGGRYVFTICSNEKSGGNG